MFYDIFFVENRCILKKVKIMATKNYLFAAHFVGKYGGEGTLGNRKLN